MWVSHWGPSQQGAEPSFPAVLVLLLVVQAHGTPGMCPAIELLRTA